MSTENSLAHTKWECKYHVVFAPKYRRQVIYKQIKLRAIRSNGRIITSKKASMLLANVMKKEMNIPLSQSENDAEMDLTKLLEED